MAPEPEYLPTLGRQVLSWIETYLATPDDPDHPPIQLTREQRQFVADLYALDPGTGRRLYRRAVLSRAKGWGKSPLLAAIACAEALGPVLFDGWDADGEPVGKPWATVRRPWVQVAAVSEDQTQNTWIPVLEMLREGPAIDEFPGLEPMGTFVNLPYGRIEPVTASWFSREGNRPVFCVLDQTETWTPSNGGRKLAKVLRRNLGKTGGTSVESPNAYTPGVESVAEDSAEYARAIREGKTRDEGLLYSHVEAPPDTDMSDRSSLLSGLRYAYGDSAASGWVDLERIVAEIHDPATDPQDSRLYYLNQITHASDQWIAGFEWNARAAVDTVVADRDTITLGFDGSRKRSRGVTDATALVGCRVSDGHVFELGVWEQPDGPAGQDWEVPVPEVEAAVRAAFDRYRVVGFYADPARWEEQLGRWEADFGPRLKVKATKAHPCQWWMTGGRATQIVRATQRLHSAVMDGDMTHDGSYALMRHVLNARRRTSTQGIQIHKEYPDSPRKIDAAIAAILAFEARGDAVAAGVLNQRAVSSRLYRY